jgi:hypothetical protein
MGRKSSLTEKQWQEIGARILKGEKPSSLAKEFGIDRAAISRRFSQQVKSVKAVANQIVAADEALKALPIAQQIDALSLVEELRAISIHLAGAGKFGAMTAHRLTGIAHGQVERIDDADPLKSQNELASIALLTKIANGAAEIGLGLLKANKDMTPEDDLPTPVAVSFGVKDAKRAVD